MASLQDIQELVDRAQEEIRIGNSDHVKEVIWPNIKDALSQCTELEWNCCEDMKKLIHKHLDEQGLHGEKPETINLKQLKEGLEKGSVQVPEQTQIIEWLSF